MQTKPRELPGEKFCHYPFLLAWFFSRSSSGASSAPRERVNYSQVLSVISQTSYLGHKHSGKYIRPNRPDSRESEPFDKQLWASLSHGRCTLMDVARCSSITPIPKGPSTPHIQDQSVDLENSRHPSLGLPPQGPRIASLSYCVALAQLWPSCLPHQPALRADALRQGPQSITARQRNPT